MITEKHQLNAAEPVLLAWKSMTKGRLTADFIKNKHGRIVSKKKSLDHSRNENKIHFKTRVSTKERI